MGAKPGEAGALGLSGSRQRDLRRGKAEDGDKQFSGISEGLDPAIPEALACSLMDCTQREPCYSICGCGTHIDLAPPGSL